MLFSAHYDHLGSKNTEGDNIFNGADDDASGTTAIINIAQYYAKQANNARTLMFAAFSAEEIGGFGSQYFSKQLNPDAITAMINIEMIGKPSKFGTGALWMTGMERSNLGTQLNQALAKSGKKIHKDPYPKQKLFYRSDNATLAKLGVPAHSFSSSQLDKDQRLSPSK
ncbi:M20/M25/M40 family metallo-hydrolase [Colwellia sp. MSW7]|uniref:M20/M25/M40 family metallo-hydrolase n=1 Tax=Colwellia maritima TaxID=2912588 RepID=A0ABS9X4Z7_9GAMM|nr:M20/M25/M40 family metallo-hydrolase [Colwellia maritima]